MIAIKLAYSVKDACNFIGCGRTYLYGLIARGKVDARKMGPRTILTGESLVRYVETLPKLKSGNASGDSSGQASQAIENSEATADVCSAKAGEAGKCLP